tara:strand:- start:30214 stop:30585 length:372 start_codon:yes stop_codon:yes gene_type:complete
MSAKTPQQLLNELFDSEPVLGGPTEIPAKSMVGTNDDILKIQFNSALMVMVLAKAFPNDRERKTALSCASMVVDRALPNANHDRLLLLESSMQDAAIGYLDDMKEFVESGEFDTYHEGLEKEK